MVEDYVLFCVVDGEYVDFINELGRGCKVGFN